MKSVYRLSFNPSSRHELHVKPAVDFRVQLGCRARIYILDQASGQMGEGTARYRIGVQGKAGLL